MRQCIWPVVVGEVGQAWHRIHFQYLSTNGKHVFVAGELSGGKARAVDEPVGFSGNFGEVFYFANGQHYTIVQESFLQKRQVNRRLNHGYTSKETVLVARWQVA